MLKAMVLILHSGLEIAFLIALLLAYLRVAGQRGLFPYLKWGAFFAIIVSLSLTFGVNSSWDREVVELVVNGLAVVLTLSLMVWLGWTNRQSPHQAGSKSSLLLPFLVFLGVTVLLIVPGLDIGLTLSKVFLETDGLVSTELATGLAAGLLALLIAGIAGVTLYKVASQTRSKWVTLAVFALLFILFARDATTTVQLMLVKGMLPLTDWLFRLIVPLVNNYGIFFYVFLGVTAALVIVTIWEWRRQKDSFEGLNPAQRRKVKAASRRRAGLFGVTILLLTLVIVSDGATAVLARRPIMLDPAIPVNSENGNIMIPVESVSDGKLYRFSFTDEDTVVRFLIVYKGSGIYGVGLDACEFCGVAGYRQEKENVICNRCSAAINKATIGFPGGCNPIPLKYRNDGNFVVIPTEEITAAKAIFAQ